MLAALAVTVVTGLDYLLKAWALRAGIRQALLTATTRPGPMEMTEPMDANPGTGPAGRVLAAAIAAGRSLATAESLTAGMIAATLAEVPGASAALVGGVVSYSNSVKANVLGVDPALLVERGSVDGEVARQMAEGARRACGADLAVSATGVAGPDAHDGKPVGTVFLGWASESGSGFTEHQFAGDRAQIRAASTSAALEVLASTFHPAATQVDGGRLL